MFLLEGKLYRRLTETGFFYCLVKRNENVMGYHLTILRIVKGKQLPISLEEAKTAASKIGGWVYSDSPPTFVLQIQDGESILWYKDGVLWAKTPEGWEIDHFLELSRELRSRVRGDEFETYISSDKTYVHQDDLVLRKIAEGSSAALLQKYISNQRAIRRVIVGIFLLLGVIGFMVGKWFENL